MEAKSLVGFKTLNNLSSTPYMGHRVCQSYKQFDKSENISKYFMLSNYLVFPQNLHFSFCDDKNLLRVQKNVGRSYHVIDERSYFGDYWKYVFSKVQI